MTNEPSTPDASAPLWNHIFRTHQTEQERIQIGNCVVARDQTQFEDTEFGRIRWYLHPRLDEPVSRSMYFLELEIPAGGHSGKLRHQGNIPHLVVEGHGYTILDDERYDWETPDVIAIPTRPEGVVFQHFAAPSTTCRLVLAWPNHDGPLGPGLGVDLALLESASVT